MATTVRVPKDPDDSDDFTWDWSARLVQGETISTAVVTVDVGAVVDTDIVGGTVIARLSGGTAGNYINARCRITTSASRQIDWTLEIPVAVQ